MKKYLYIPLLLIFMSLFSVENSISATVTNLNDSGPGSLRDAIASTPSGGTVDFAVTGTITLLSEIVISSKDLTIRGPRGNLLTVSGGNSTRIFRMTGSSSVNTIVVSGLRLSNGFADERGAAIRLSGPNLILNDCVLDSNIVTCSSNSCGVNGGAIAHTAGGTTTTINRTTFSNNSATCTGNDCTARGGAIQNGGGGVTIEVNNSTFASNSATCSGDSCLANGGAFFSPLGEVNNSTFASNSASCVGPNCNELGNSIFGENFSFYSSIFTTDSPGSSCYIEFDITSLGYNIDDGSTCIDGSGIGDKPNTPAGLNPSGLQNNGGPTPTIALLDSSQAVNMGDPLCPPPATDQRGIPRPQGSSCDIGAFELRITNVPTLSEWGLIAMAGILGIAGFMVIRRRTASAGV